jgi:transcriptional regulator with GAF, ATPase, and Fis domain
VQAEDLPPEMQRSAVGPGAPVRLPPEGLDWDRMEEELLRQALDRTDGNRAAAARLLGLSYKAFLYRVEKFGL